MKEIYAEMDVSTIFGVVILACVLLMMVIYVITLSRSKRGLMITYRGWTDLCVSSLWIPLLPLGLLMSAYEFAEFGSKITMWRIFGAIVLAGGVVSFLWLFFFAAKNNWFHPWSIFLAVNTRLMASFIVVLSVLNLLGLWSRKSKDRRESFGSMMSSLLLTGGVFVMLVRPLVHVDGEECRGPCE